MSIFKTLIEKLGLISFSASNILKDGTVLKINGDLKEGTKVFVVTEDADVPLPDGSYELETGEIILVKDGQIESIEAAKTEEEKKAEEQEPVVAAEDPVPAEPVEPEDNPAEPDKVAELEVKVAELESKLNEIIAKIGASAEADEAMKSENAEMKAKLETFEAQLSKLDGSKPSKKNKTEIVQEQNTRLEQLRKMRNH